ncbi:MAG TPA: TonB family protein [Caldimonas sp.]|nr:TonB family protein [Caldimonas sp.]
MNAAALERDMFAPHQPPGMRSGLALAVLAHVLLILALAWSVNWKASEPEGVVAELWSALPQTAAPRPAPLEPKPAPPVEPKPAPPVAKPQPAPPPPADAQIAVERAAREKARREEAERVEAARQAELRKREDAKREEAKRADAKRVEAERQRAAEQAEQKKLAEQAKKDEARQAAIREANLRRMMKEAGTSDDPGATGTAARTSGPSASYAGRIKARIKPNIVLTSSVAGNPAATIEVRVAPDGTIVARKLVSSSGSPAWDETVLRAIDKTEVLPKDTDGRVPPVISITFRPLD